MLIKSNKLNFQAALIIMHFILNIFPTIIFSLQQAKYLSFVIFCLHKIFISGKRPVWHMILMAKHNSLAFQFGSRTFFSGIQSNAKASTHVPYFYKTATFPRSAWQNHDSFLAITCQEKIRHNRLFASMDRQGLPF